ncbi:MAG: hypothetical protein APG12_01098 [Candidatus Methanofastidiosum methylothiophilum]|uniref:ACR n=1 Tax=Candidatus Methanofastidiosum methylothiophilum TaxID=1705564 RepID=A0A150IQY4_9EURY|nr:MAG: hypothetical protein APG10_01445 [Candidatus Methanofastidiosum methylthiophilus]KYC47451.1 MAG: hypothetical protein APG11_01142 [Candidatus Methanofastidiosum methylthiophilus]KYC50010.1 MAG: hypothetical protein APG12_01098 [Candidatus Methanofastidiosum methylthiophilus]
MSSHDLSKMFDKLTYQRNFFELSRGLMFRKDITGSNEAYIFVLNRERKAAITMLFVFFSIDVIWLDSKFEVIDSKENVKSFSFHTGHKGKAKYFIEMPLGAIKKHKIKIGDKIIFPV